MASNTIKEELQNVKKGWNLLLLQRATKHECIGEGDSIIEAGTKSLARLEELIEDLDPEGVK